MPSELFQRLLKEVKPENSQFVEKNMAIADQVREILDTHPTIKTQKALAEALGKEPSEISRWLSGLHNIGLENITRMEVALGSDIILTDRQARERYDRGCKDFRIYKVDHFKPAPNSLPFPGWSGERNITLHQSTTKTGPIN